MPGFAAGLSPTFPSPSDGEGALEDVVTEEAGILPPADEDLRVTAVVEEGQVVAQGAPVACLRDAPDLCLVAPMTGRVARIDLRPGRKLSEIVLFREAGEGPVTHKIPREGDVDGLRGLIQRAGGWPWLRRRPFGGMPDAGERPAAIAVMATDTRPFAPDPRDALKGRELAFHRGLRALAALTEGPVLVFAQAGPPLLRRGMGDGRIRAIECGPRHPQGAPGIQIHRVAPAEIDAPVWDIHAEDVAALGTLLETGILPVMRHVRIAGSALRAGRVVRTQQGADLRELTRRITLPGSHMLIAGSPLERREARWLGPRQRQVTVLPRPSPPRPRHWLAAALTQSARGQPVIPTAALSQAFGRALPAAPFVRALGSGDDEAAMKLGVLSLLEEDLALADYVLGQGHQLAGLLRGMLARIRTELAA